MSQDRIKALVVEDAPQQSNTVGDVITLPRSEVENSPYLEEYDESQPRPKPTQDELDDHEDVEYVDAKVLEAFDGNVAGDVINVPFNQLEKMESRGLVQHIPQSGESLSDEKTREKLREQSDKPTEKKDLEVDLEKYEQALEDEDYTEMKSAVSDFGYFKATGDAGEMKEKLEKSLKRYKSEEGD